MTEIAVHCKYDALEDPKKLKNHPKNRNKHSKEQVERLAELYKYHGIRHPIIVSKLSGCIVAGHGRKASAINAGIKGFPVVHQDFDSDESEYAFVQSDNAIALWAELDIEGIRDDIDTLSESFDVRMLALKDLEDIQAEKVPLCDEDEVPEHVEPKTRLGDVYQLGDHRLMCGDSTSIDAVENLMDGEKADMVFTDPPYGMNLDTHYDKMFGNDSSHVKTGNRFQRVKGDDVDYDPNPIFSIEAKEYYIWGADYFYDKLPKGGSWIAWDKRDENLDKVPGNTTEFLWSKNPHRRMSLRVKWSGHHGMQKEDVKKRIHPTQKPVALIEKFFDELAGKHKSIVDIYGGSGTTLIACEKTNRKCFMMELDPHYCDVIVQRWENYTGKKAELVNG